MKKKFLLVVSFLIFLLTMAGCELATTDLITTDEVTLKSLMLSKTTATVNVGDSYTLPTTAIAKYSDETTKTVIVTWDKSINTTTSGVKTYTAIYTEGAVNVVAEFSLIVLPKTEEEIETVTSLILLQTTATITQGDSYTLPETGTVIYSNGTSKTAALTWDKTVNTAIPGTALYTASYTESGVRVEAMFVLIVVDEIEVEVKLSSLVLGTITATITQGDSYTLPVIGTATYSDGTTKTVVLTWDKTLNTGMAGTSVYTASYTENGVKVEAKFVLIVEEGVVMPSFTIENVTASLNGTVEVIIKASEFTQNATGVDLRLYADNTYLKFVSAEFTGVAAGGLTIAKQESTNNILVATVTNSTEGVLLDGSIIKFKFTAIKTGSTVVNINSATLLDVYSLKITDTNISDTAIVTIQ